MVREQRRLETNMNVPPEDKCQGTHHSDKVLPPALMTGSDRVYLSPQFTRQKQIFNILYSETPKKPPTPQLPNLVLGNLKYTEREGQAYHIGRNKRCNTDEYYELSIDATGHVPDQLCKAALMIGKSKKIIVRVF